MSIITHEDIFVNKSHLPVFSSPAIETHLHRIPGLARYFIYFNDDVFLGATTWPDDFKTQSRGQRVFLAWEIPKCSPGCVDTWIGDKFCDTVCGRQCGTRFAIFFFVFFLVFV
jgi:UDP-N-acetylglucosamine-lysosomal-enzyme